MSNLQSLEQRMDRVDYQVISDDKDKRIADLEAKLAESEKNVEFYQERYSNATTSAYGADLIAKNIQSRLEEEIRELKQQLAEKEKKIEKLQHCNDRLAQGIYHSYGEHFILKVNQDKISFALEQLKRVEKLLLDNAFNDLSVVLGEIDNQIEELNKELNK